ncbi:MAG TPA: hypothetical protein VFF11_10635, partial [Candidatus Binatia bacterium]|nr:hypothetical protein [Candidatus Binatia bacterium]
MKPCPPKLLLILAIGAAALSVPAQETVVVSKPADAQSDKASPVMGNSERRINAGDYRAPKAFLNDFSPTLPMPRPLYLGNANASAANEANKRKNWTLLTPEEILGVQTPEKILGNKDKKTDQDLSLEDQYLLRLRSAATSGLTNGRAGGPGWQNNDNNNPFDQRNSRDSNNPFDNSNPFNRYNNNDNPPFPSGRMADAQQPGQGRDLSGFFNHLDPTAAAQQKQPESIWTSPFAQPVRPETAQEQLDAMERFRALMEPGSLPDKDKMVSQTRYSPPAKSASPSPSFFQQQPQYNPAGQSVDLLRDNSTRPTGLQPLPGVTGPALKPPEQKPSWQPQLPPWMRTG